MVLDSSRASNLLSFGARRACTTTGALLLTLIVGSLLLTWNWPVAFSAVRSLKTPSGQPQLRIPNDTSSIQKALVIPKTRHDDVRWVEGISSTFTPFIYSTDIWPEPQYLHPHTLAGREASAYLSYIIDYYDALPKYSYFIHAAEDQWHNDVFSKATNQPDTLRSLRTQAIDKHGYVNLRCKLHPGCPADIKPFAPEGQEMPRGNSRVDFAKVYQEVLGVEKEAVPKMVGNVCCAQFAVSRERILMRRREEYMRMLEWAEGKHELDGFGVGFVF